jgi:predicted lipoprotein with Yx(FWY)xxD motif
MNTNKTYAALLALAVAAILIVSACGAGNDSSAADSTPSGGQTVAVSNVDGVGDVLVDAQGAALYASDEEAGGDVLCTESCLAFWDPLTVPEGADLPTGADLGGKLGVVKRPDGARQVTLSGRPLYRFTEDTGPGVVTGNGFADSFGSQAFTWHVATPKGISTSSSNSSSDGLGY